MGKLFGTDGVRGVANVELTTELALNIGKAAGMVVWESVSHRPVVVVGMDTRISSHMLEAALAAGLSSVGVDVKLLGVVPTPAVALLVKKYGADAGVMISASHNPFEYNGIKIFGSKGHKLTDEQENEIEEIILNDDIAYKIQTGAQVGQVEDVHTAVEDYIAHVKQTVDVDFKGLRIAMDCSNGSASVTAHKLFSELGAECAVLSAEPDGVNINLDCGSTHIGHLAEILKAGEFDIGFAFDGDADRCLAVDENGEIIDGDQIIAMLAYDLKQKGRLHNNTVVVTVMSNIGLFKFAEQNGIQTATTKVGDRYVLECMLEEGHNIGGEQSGHIIYLDHASTGDGQLTAAHLLQLLKQSGRKASELASIMQCYPQTMVNVIAPPALKTLLDTDEAIRVCIEREQEKLGSNGRVLVRASGTEPLIRVMVEGQDKAEISAIAKKIADVIEAAK